MGNEFIKWNNIYSLGTEKIDIQHKKLIDIINKLFNAFSEGNADTIISEILNELTDYTQYHFKTEEEIFEKYNYPEKENHKNSHEEFVQKVTHWKTENSENDTNLPYELMEYLKKWLLEHILKEDKNYSKYFADKKISL